MILKNLSEAKAEFSDLIEAVSKGDEVIICRAGVPIAKIARYSGAAVPRHPGALKGKIKIAPDFDVLPDDLRSAFGMNDEIAP